MQYAPTDTPKGHAGRVVWKRRLPRLDLGRMARNNTLDSCLRRSDMGTARIRVFAGMTEGEGVCNTPLQGTVVILLWIPAFAGMTRGRMQYRPAGREGTGR